MSYWQLYYHVVWSTKNRLPLITPQLEPTIYEYLRDKALELEATVFALNGIADHVHLVTSIPPKLAVAKFVGQIKAFTATKFNKTVSTETPLIWQEEYGVLSFDSKRLPNFVAYVENQKAHHNSNSLIPVLERSADSDVRAVREPAPTYEPGDDTWFRTMQEQSTD